MWVGALLWKDMASILAGAGRGVRRHSDVAFGWIGRLLARVEPECPVAWNYIVTNTGNVPLNPWSVSDNHGVTITCPDVPILQPGESVTCFANQAKAQAGQYSNTATVRGTTPSDTEVTDEDPSHYFGVVGGVSIVKLTQGENPNEPPGPSIPVGDTVSWTYRVTNAGNSQLTDVVVTDTKGADVTCPKTTLAVNEIMDCTATGTATPGTYTNFGQVTGRTPTGDEVGAEDPSYYFGEDPGISLQKFTNGVDAPAAPGPDIDVGQPISWTYVVTNTGNAPLHDINVTDDQGVTVTCPDGAPLNPGDQRTCTASGTSVIGQHQNIGTVTGLTPTGRTLTDDDTSHYFGSVQSVQVKKLVNGQDANDPPGPSIPVGRDITWTYQVTNTGNIPIIKVVLTDDQGLTPQPVDGAGTGNLNPGVTWVYEAHSTAVAGQHQDWPPRT